MSASARAARPTTRTSCFRRCVSPSVATWKSRLQSSRLIPLSTLAKESTVTDTHSDALVFFGATGDLAYKKIFPALQAMIKRGSLNAPVIGVAKAGWNLDQLKARAKDSVEQHGGLDGAAWKKLSSLLKY